MEHEYRLGRKQLCVGRLINDVVEDHVRLLPPRKGVAVQLKRAWS